MSRLTRGFTLIELMVAMTIFAVLAAAGWKVFDGLMKVRERASQQAAQLMEQQRAYGQLLRDVSQTISRTARAGTAIQAALLLDGQTLKLTRTGMIDPLLIGQGPLVRVEYRLESDRLVRVLYRQPDQLDVEQPNKTVILHGVSRFQVKALNPDAQLVWPPTAQADMMEMEESQRLLMLPKAVDIQIEQSGLTLNWQFMLPPQLPPSVVQTSTPPKNPPT